MNLYDEIARLAYELYEKSGCIPCREIENWLEAERMVLLGHASQEMEEPEETVFIEEVEVIMLPAVPEEAKVAGRAEKIKSAKKAGPVKKVAAKGKKEAPKKEVKKTAKKTTRKKGE